MGIRLSSVAFELTDICNFKCTHCYVKKRGNTLDKSIVRYLAEILLKENIGYIVLTGGEPLLHPKFLEIYTFLRENGLLIDLFTNGYYLESIYKYKDLLQPHMIEMSIYSFSEGKYYEITGIKNAFSTIIKNIKVLKQQGYNFVLKYVLMNQNEQDLKIFIEYCKRNKINYSINPALYPNGKKKFRISIQKLNTIKNENEVQFIIPEKGFHLKCDAGDSIFISSDCYIKGCPVLPKEKRVTSQTTTHEIEEIINGIKRKYKNSDNYIYCPGWEMVEKRELINKYFESKEIMELA